MFGGLGIICAQGSPNLNREGGRTVELVSNGTGRYLKMLKSVGDKAEEASNKNGVKNVDFDEMYSHIRDNLKRIDSQEVTITGILNEEYNGWYNGSGACQTPISIV